MFGFFGVNGGFLHSMRTNSFLTFGSGSLSDISIRYFKSSQRPSKQVKSTKASKAQSLTPKRK